MEKVERAILTIVLIVALVGVVGLFASYDFAAPQDALSNGVTGNVVESSTQSCSTCSGYAPVCAKVNNRYVTFDNECLAVCANANVATTGPCDHIRRA